MKIFSELGVSVEEAWREANYSETAFPEIASKALAGAGLREKVTPWEIIRWLASESQLPRQPDIEAMFGNPPITLFCGPRFYIDIYFWVDGTTEIHQHGFAGAFQVLAGSSIHSRYSFLEEHEITQHFRFGRVKFESCELLQEEAVRPIIAGGEHIHALFHLDRPSATITVRTFGLPGNQPQYSYHKPHIAIDPFYKEASLMRKVQSVAMLLDLRETVRDELIADLLATADLHTTFLILHTVFLNLSSNQLEKIFQLSTGRDRFDKLLEKARERHGSLVDYIPPVLEEQDRVANIVRRRAFITTPEHRFFLALILNVPSLTKLLDLVRERFPEKDPVDTVLDWVMDLSTTKVWGSAESNVLGIDDFNDDYLLVLECLLREHSAEQIRAMIEIQYPADAARRLQGEFEDIAGKLRHSVLFRAVLGT